MFLYIDAYLTLLINYDHLSFVCLSLGMGLDN